MEATRLLKPLVQKRVIRICEAISEMTGRDQTLLEQELVVAKLNRMMIGWANYFCLGPVSNAYNTVEKHACKRLRQWLCAKHKVMSGTQRFSRASHYVLGLVPYQAATPFPVGDIVNLSPRAGSGKSAHPVR